VNDFYTPNMLILWVGGEVLVCVGVWCLCWCVCVCVGGLFVFVLVGVVCYNGVDGRIDGFIFQRLFQSNNNNSKHTFFIICGVLVCWCWCVLVCVAKILTPFSTPPSPCGITETKICAFLYL
jgi:hypothetical protein